MLNTLCGGSSGRCILISYLGAVFPLHEARHRLYPSVGIDTVSIISVPTQFEFDLDSFEETESLEPNQAEAVQSEVALSLAHQPPCHSSRCDA